MELPPTAKFDRSDPNYESLHYAVNHQHSVSVRTRSDPPYATVGHADDGADSTEEPPLRSRQGSFAAINDMINHFSVFSYQLIFFIEVMYQN